VKKGNLYESELKDAFSNWKSLRKFDLRDFYKQHFEELTENKFRRILYALETQNIIQKIDTGLYVLEDPKAPIFPKNNFTPTFSSEVSSIYMELVNSFPYLKYLIWETKILYEFMIHQPKQNQIILEIEQGGEESVFNYIYQKFEGKVFLYPDSGIIERYTLSKNNPIFISTLLIQAPIQYVKKIPCPKVEKILVDIFADEEKLYIFQGKELINIFESVFSDYHVGQKALFRYAQRRKIHQELRDFITEKTNIQLYQYRETKL